MSVKHVVGSIAKRLEKVGEHKAGELHHIEIHPAENGFTVEHHTHKGKNKYGYDEYGTDKQEHVFESHHAAAKHVKGIMEEHADSMEGEGEMHQSGVMIGKKDKRSKEENATGA